MAENDLNHLNYGHYGLAAFDLESRDWTFARDGTAVTLKQITIYHEGEASTEVVPAATHYPSIALSTRNTDANGNVQNLLRNHPEIVPASDLLTDLAVTSAAVLSTASIYDPLVGELLSLGSVTSGRKRTEDSKRRKSDSFSETENPRRIVATVAGEAGNVLRLALFYKATHGWGDDRSIWLKGETLKDTESGYWNDDAAPIQQVCFAQSEEKSTLLAVRLPIRTVLFRPTYSRQRTRPATRSVHYDLPSSLIDAHPILSLGIEESGGSPHADVTFNPEFQLQFAVVDTSATWSIWEIEKGRKGDKYSMSRSTGGYITSLEDADLTGEDGWARVLWVGDVNTILVCNRRHLSIIDITGGTSSYLSCPTLFGHRSSDWILDVKRHPTTRGCFFLLTSTFLFLMAVTTSSDPLGLNSGEVGAHILLSWNHFRGAEDFTLHISVQMLRQDGMR
jgi:RNA polymerase I-specific transcription initiation factor RRN6